LDANRAYKIPIAHGEGRFFCDDATLQSLEENQQILFQYCDEAGEVTESSNPNGSLRNIAGITNKGRNVFGMMPHPERAADALVANEDGMALFQSILNHCS
jgi:phosphoribosylformylglycinamidine synthase